MNNLRNINFDFQLLGYSEREAIIIREIYNSHPEKISRKNILSVFKIRKPSQATFWRILDKLSKDNIVKQKDKGRNTGYVLNIDKISKQYLALKKVDRELTYFDKRFFENYIPNETSILKKETTDELNRLSEAAIIDGGYSGPLYGESINSNTINNILLSNNSYLPEEAYNFLQNGQIPSHRTSFETASLESLKKLNEYLYNNRGYINIDITSMCHIHSKISNHRKLKYGGQLRKKSIENTLSNYRPPKHEDIDFHFEKGLIKAKEIKNPFEKYIYLLLLIEYISPWEHNNGKLSRCIANVPLLEKTLIPVSWHGIDKNSYIYAINAFKELHTTHQIEDLLLKSYKASCFKFRNWWRKADNEKIHLYGFNEKQQGKIKKCVRDYVLAINDDDHIKIDDFIYDYFSHLPLESVQRYSDAIKSTIKLITTETHANYGISEKEYYRFREISKD